MIHTEPVLSEILIPEYLNKSCPSLTLVYSLTWIPAEITDHSKVQNQTLSGTILTQWQFWRLEDQVNLIALTLKQSWTHQHE